MRPSGIHWAKVKLASLLAGDYVGLDVVAGETEGAKLPNQGKILSLPRAKNHQQQQR